MLITYLKIALRNILRNKSFSIINILGLAIGMAACITIFVFIQHEYGVDGFNKKADRIYRVNVAANLNGKNLNAAVTPAPLGAFLKEKFPQVEKTTTLYALGFVGRIKTPTLKYGEKLLRTDRFIFADSSFFDVFSFKMIRGDPESALSLPFSVVLSQSASQRFFGDGNPIGKNILYNSKFHFTVTGVVKDPPSNSTIQFDYLASLKSLPPVWGYSALLKQRNQNFNYYTYVLLNKGAGIKNVEERMGRIIPEFWSKPVTPFAKVSKFHFENLKEQYWDNKLGYDLPKKGNSSSVAAFAVIGIIILLIACANFINMSTARALTRAKEVGIRKVVGGQRAQLIGQFMIESGLMSFVALLAAVALSEFFIPLVNKYLGTTLRIDYFNNNSIGLIIVGIWILTSFFAGIIPALYLSSFHPAATIKGNLGGVAGKRTGGRFFVLFQFSAVIALIFCTIVVAKQYYHLRFHNIGFDKDNILILHYDQGANGNYIPFKQKLLEDTHILGVTASDVSPGGLFPMGGRYFKSNSGVENMMTSFGVVDPDYIKVYGIKLLAGRDFSWKSSAGDSPKFILNETAARKIGWTPQEAVGKPFGFNPDPIKGEVIGVLSDFNFQSLRSEVEPLVLEQGNDVEMLSVKMSQYQPAATLAYIEKTWQKIFPNSPIEYDFLDKNLDALYKSELKLGVLFTLFSLLSIIIACMGLYGLSLYSAERRTKEVGVRKVLGASVTGVVILLSKEFAKWVLVANLIAWPAAYFLMNKWLLNFAYRIDISPWMFIIAGITALAIAMITTSFHAIRAATANPVESLRYE